MKRTTKRITIALLVAFMLLVAALAGYVWFGPVAVGDKKVLLDFMLGRGIAAPSPATIARRLKAPPGFTVRAYSIDVPLARFMVITPEGDLIVSRTRADEVVLLERDRNGDGKPDAQRALLKDLKGPHGLALQDGWLYVGESDAVGRVRFDSASGKLIGAYQRILTRLTHDGFHQTKTVGFGPDGWLYLSQGSSCNFCIEKDTRRATMMRMRPDGTGAEIYATGLRNSVGFDWAPWDGALYATENGRDLLGDDFPPDELNRIEQGRFYGWPYVNGYGVLDPDLGKGQMAKLAETTVPAHGFRPHNAPLGIRFLRSPGLPPELSRTALVALHGSWNRTQLDGYKVVALQWAADGTITERDFLTGFLGTDGIIIGRPAGITEGPDGAIYVSDDYAGVIYRVTYTGNQVRQESITVPAPA
jgi:glucose/arabinose dehydrogenase